jgi:hypothetical protein
MAGILLFYNNLKLLSVVYRFIIFKLIKKLIYNDQSFNTLNEADTKKQNIIHYQKIISINIEL